MSNANATPSSSDAPLDAPHTLPTSSKLALQRGLQADADRWRSEHQSQILSAQGSMLAGLLMLLLLFFMWRRCRRWGAEERPAGASKRLKGSFVDETTAWLRHRRGSTGSTGSSINSAIEMDDLRRDETRRAPDALASSSSGGESNYSPRSPSDGRARRPSSEGGVMVFEDGTMQVLSVPTLIASTSQPPSVLSHDQLLLLRKNLPPRFGLCDWALLYSTEQHGCSLRTCYSRLDGSCGTLLVCLDGEGHIFGSFVTEEWTDVHRDGKRYFGNGETFLFKMHPTFRRYNWTRRNDHFVLAAPDCLAFGGGGHFGLYFDGSFEYGSSQESATFENDCLASTPQFKVIKVEVWGFVHEGRDFSGATRTRSRDS
jgi:hypothetical protein